MKNSRAIVTQVSFRFFPPGNGNVAGGFIFEQTHIAEDSESFGDFLWGDGHDRESAGWAGVLRFHAYKVIISVCAAHLTQSSLSIGERK